MHNKLKKVGPKKRAVNLTALFYSINRINYALSPINTDSNAISIISLNVN